MKVCSGCKETKGLEEFYKNKSQKDGLENQCKDCRKKYRQNNKEKIAERQRKWNQENKERIAERNKKYYQENKERIVKRQRKYRKTNYQRDKEKIVERGRKYRENNKEKEVERHRKYYQDNREKIAEYRQNNKEKIAERQRKYREKNPYQVQSNYLSNSVRQRAKKRKLPIDLDFISSSNIVDWLKHQPNCVCCDRVFGIGYKGKFRFQNNSPSLDRLIPSLGYISGNVFLICFRCNALKRDATVKELETVISWMKKTENYLDGFN